MRNEKKLALPCIGYDCNEYYDAKDIIHKNPKLKKLQKNLQKRLKTLTEVAKNPKASVVKECPKADCVGVAVVKKPKAAKKATPKKKKKKTSKKKKVTKKKGVTYKCAVCAHKWNAGLARKKIEEVLPKGAKRCPGCGIATFKDEGCDHMSCQICGADYSWDGQKH